MDGLLKILASACEGTWANKDFIATLAIVWQLKTFKGMFNVQEIKIKHIDEKADNADKKSDKALEIVREVRTCTDKIHETVQEVKCGYKEFILDKDRKSDAEKKAS